MLCINFSSAVGALTALGATKASGKLGPLLQAQLQAGTPKGRLLFSAVPFTSLAAGGVKVKAAGGNDASGSDGLGGESKPRPKSPADFGHPRRRVTDVLLALNVVMFGLQAIFKPSLLMWGAKINSKIAAGQLYRLVSCTVLHTNIMHLFINCQAINALGPFVETNSGRARYTAVYALAGISGSLFSYRFSPNAAVGASGAIFGLGGALAMLLWRHRDRDRKFTSGMLKSLGRSLALNVVLGIAIPNIDLWGHTGGLLGGALAAFLLGPNITEGPDGEMADRPPLPLLAFKTHG
eukprot:CAMPEP_0206149880 /NCGR_PEP_ID=MMETSP1473-20131121/38009_1 /ASSEMBLY_ACC=CAM_ASM_001109 /TAXON_ID=1461547 /ORGANISM="Stichococcus sp, Strain RCC1054" /LENGTH=293 /DNA_ID=CAMNT_0053547363 /DNA_START=627 /DNA_END=1509 /DNA_ORIENTATION=-